MRIILIGLRRSGTTALLHLFRQDARLVCFDEPFNPMIRDIPARDEWGTKAEYVDLYNRRPDAFWAKYAYIDGLDEIRGGLTPAQSAWVSYLLESAPETFMDFTRAHFKLDALYALAPDALLIHLHRSPAAFATSHILPSVWKDGRAFKYWRQKKKFWTIQSKYNTWGMETVIGRSDTSLCAERFREFDIDPGPVYAASAATRLAAFWLMAFRAAERDGRRLYGDNYLQVPFASFTHDPAGYMADIYRRLGTDMPAFDFSAVRPAADGAYPGHPGWRAIERTLGVDPERPTFDGDLMV